MDLSHLLGGATKGLEYMAKVIKVRIAADKAGNAQEEADASAVEMTWAQEVMYVISNPLSALGDPFRESRHQAQALFAKYGVK